MSDAGQSPSDESGAPPIDTTKASIARVYDAFLGGKDNYEVDRAVCDVIYEIAPEASAFARAFRGWLIRAVRFLAAEAGIDQFLDCGSGLPTAENTHQAVQRINPEARVVYVDNDPIVAAHGLALLEENDHTHFVAGDLRHPDTLLSHPVITKHLDWDRPLALIQCATLHHLHDAEKPHEIMASYINALPSGSYVALAHFYDPADGSTYSELARGIETRFRDSSMGTGRFRTRAEITRFFDGLELVEPGLVRMVDWWPDGPRLTSADVDHIGLGAVGRKP
jgi:hypothetical protein